MTEPTPFYSEGLRAFAASGVTAAEAATGTKAFLASFGVPTVDTVPTCTHPDGCTNPVTHQMHRPATPDEAEAHWNALEANIRAHGNPDYVQNRNSIPGIADLRCDDPQHADPAYLKAKAREGTDAPPTTGFAAITASIEQFQLAMKQLMSSELLAPEQVAELKVQVAKLPSINDLAGQGNADV